jgi:maltose O-acetyltransferase
VISGSVPGARPDPSAAVAATADPARRPGRRVAALAYWGLARHLPWSPRPGGAVAKTCRGLLAGRMLDHCGSSVNVEHGAWFGSGKGIRLGDRSDIGMDALIIGPVSIGNDVMMGPRCMLLSDRHDISDPGVPMNTQGFLPSLPIVIGDDVFIGAGAVVLAGVHIGSGSVVGAGAVVVKDVPAGCVVAGNPAVVVRRRGPT